MCKIKELDLRLLCCSPPENPHNVAHVLTSLSCFMNMEKISETVENEEPHDSIMDRIVKGKFLKPWFGMSCVVAFYSDSPLRPCSKTECYFEWDFTHPWSKKTPGTPRTWTLGSGHIKNLYVNPDFGKEGLQSNQLELHCTLIN